MINSYRPTLEPVITNANCVQLETNIAIKHALYSPKQKRTLALKVLFQYKPAGNFPKSPSKSPLRCVWVYHGPNKMYPHGSSRP